MSSESFTFSVVQTALIGIGIIGNVITILVFLRKTFRSNSISTYCIALAIIELLSIIQFISNITFLAYNANLADLSDSLCKLVYFSGVLLSSNKPWITVAFSVDKLLSMRTRSILILKKKWFQWSTIAAIFLFNAALFLYYPILIKRSEKSPGNFMCDLTTMGFFKIHSILVLIETCFIPLIIMAITSIFTIRLLIKSRNAVVGNGQGSKERKSRDRKYAVSSVTFNIMFIVLKLPISTFYFLNAFFNYYDLYFIKIGTTLFFLNSSLSVCLHLVTNSLFRREFLTLFRFVNSNSGTSSNQVSDKRRVIRRLNQVSASL